MKMINNSPSAHM